MAKKLQEYMYVYNYDGTSCANKNKKLRVYEHRSSMNLKQ